MLADLPQDAAIKAVTNVNGGTVGGSFVTRVDPDGFWRVGFDVQPDGTAPMELTTYLSLADRPLSETWHFQWRAGDEKRRV